MDTIVFDLNELVPLLYNKCLKEQLSIFCYNSRDQYHIYLSKHMIIVDTIIRMTWLYSRYLQKAQSKFKFNRICLLYSKSMKRITKQCRILPLKTIITEENNQDPTDVSIELLLFQLGMIIENITKFLNKAENSEYLKFEEYIKKFNNYNIYSGTIKGSNAIFKLSEGKVSNVLYVINKQISEVLAPINMRLDITELSLVLFEFIKVIAKGVSGYKTRVLFIDDYPKHSIKDLGLSLYHKECRLGFVQIVNPGKDYTYLADEHIIYFDKHIEDKNIFTQLRSREIFKLKPKNELYIPNFNSKNYKKYHYITFNDQSVESLLYHMDNVYKYTLMYINPYSKLLFENFYTMYIKNKFKTPNLDYFEDTELDCCPHDIFSGIILSLIEFANKEFQANIAY